MAANLLKKDTAIMQGYIFQAQQGNMKIYKKADQYRWEIEE